MNDYNQLMGQPWPPSPEQELARALAIRYIEETERLDFGVCTGSIRADGGRRPCNGYEVGQCSRNARETEQRLLHGTGVRFTVFRDARHQLWNTGEAQAICRRVNQELNEEQHGQDQTTAPAGTA